MNSHAFIRPSLLLRRIQKLAICFLWLTWTTEAKGGELATYTTTPLEANVSHRQYVCDRYELFREGKIELRDALSGLSLRPLMLARKFFVYDPTTGIPTRDPGLAADLLDAVAESANFTWRDSFGIMELPQVFNKTWTEMLLWGVETYDIAVYSWDQSLERMEKGVAYVEPFFDGSLILVDQKDPPEDGSSINLLNWALPFEPAVWAVTIFTIVLSACVYQLIEHLNGEREGRPMVQWFSDNLFLSSLNFTQNFEYAPNSVAGRIFSVSMGLWALVMTATYTANLASLFVEELRYPIVVDSIEQAIKLDYPICTYGNTNADRMVKEKHPEAIRIPKDTELETFMALRRGECKLAISYKDNWLSFRGNQQYNPDCDLEWVGRDVDVIKSGFAIKADAGYRCTSLIRDVFNLHLVELIGKGVLRDAWEEHRAKTRDVTCDLEEDNEEDQSDRRLNEDTKKETKKAEEDFYVHAATPRQDYRRKLKQTTSKGASTVEGASDSSLTLVQMTGTFVLHWALMAISVMISLAAPYMLGSPCNPSGADRITYRKHGPIIGEPPPVNTYAIHQMRKSREKVLARSQNKTKSSQNQSTSTIAPFNFRNSLRDLANLVEDLHTVRSMDQSNSNHHQRLPPSADTEPDILNANSERLANRLHMWSPDKESSDHQLNINVSQPPEQSRSAVEEKEWSKDLKELQHRQEGVEKQIKMMDAKMDMLIMLMQQNVNATAYSVSSGGTEEAPKEKIEAAPTNSNVNNGVSRMTKKRRKRNAALR